jgi:hypothetical protein
MRCLGVREYEPTDLQVEAHWLDRDDVRGEDRLA